MDDGARKQAIMRIVAPILTAIVIAAVYACGSWSNGFVYDDHEVLEKQYPIQHLNDLGRIFREPHYLNFPYYRPVTRTTFAIQKRIWGDDPRPYHLFNATLGGAVTLSAWGLLRRPALALSPAAALIAAAWFGLHPAISECVYPAASGRESLLPIFFILLATWAYLGRGTGAYWLAMTLFAIALLCKEQATVLPGIFLLADILGLASGPGRISRCLLRLLPSAIILVAYFVARHFIFGKSTLQWTILKHPLDPLWSLLYGIQTAIAPFMPLHYEPPLDRWLEWHRSIASLALTTVLIISVALSGKTVRLAAIFWLGWFVLLQVPTAHLLQQEAAYSERYAALAILALPACAGAILSDRVIRADRRYVAAIGAVLWVTLLGCVSFLRGTYYSNEMSFCIQWQNTNPDAAGAYDGFGLIAQQRHEGSTAIESYEHALRIEPNDATAHNNLANLLADQGDFSGAAEHYEWLLHHGGGTGADPASTMTNYAQMLGQEAFARRDAALADHAHQLLEQAITLRPDYAHAHYMLGIWNAAFGSRAAAVRQFKIALQLQPDSKEAWDQLRRLQTSPTTQ
jgi:tetratricopeptide (TPR) repeat protein